MAESLDRRILRELADLREQTVDYLASGNPKDYAEYREYVGRVVTLDKFTQWLNELMSQFREGD